MTPEVERQLEAMSRVQAAFEKIADTMEKQNAEEAAKSIVQNLFKMGEGWQRLVDTLDRIDIAIREYTKCRDSESPKNERPEQQ